MLRNSNQDNYINSVVGNELETSGRPYCPAEYPPWLLLELEQNIHIRPQQAEIAHKLITSNHSSCLQLQMGEGKSSVIVPLMCAAISNRIRCTRVNVLPSLFHTSIEDLRAKLGGLLDRPIFVFPFQRNLPVNSNILQIMFDQMQLCLKTCGVIITSPEHRLSFLLKWKQTIFDTTSGINQNIPEKILSWWDQNVVDVLDESDEQLRHKFQLLYPIGMSPFLIFFFA